ncbi:DsbA family protein [Flavobacterium sp. H122]|uniref:DsbA family protein n=1 Tax=Flavobacterium sp. H122 TaxID=2529860 RepID=UPI0010AA77E7|nr:DsbA family protein [Flavobacterium sp. H122]
MKTRFFFLIVAGFCAMILGCSKIKNDTSKAMENTTNTEKTDYDNGFACDLNTGKCSISSNSNDEIESSLSGIKNGKLIYVGDPICSTCLAFSSEIKALKKEFDGVLDFQLVLGGLRPYGKEPISNMRDYLLPHFANLAKTTGLPINNKVLYDDSFILDTEPPSRAVVVMRQLAPQIENEFYERVQKAFYINNSNTNYVEAYLDFVEEFGIKKEIFKEKFESNEIKELVKSDFEFARNIGVTAFPTVLLESNGQFTIISRGFSKSELMIDKVRSQLYAKQE